VAAVLEKRQRTVEDCQSDLDGAREARGRIKAEAAV
jgi:hypothetical protein